MASTSALVHFISPRYALNESIAISSISLTSPNSFAERGNEELVISTGLNVNPAT